MSVLAAFAYRKKRFYLANVFFTLVFGLFLYQGRQSGAHLETFVFGTAFFFLWLYNVRRLAHCPACNRRPSYGKAILYFPKECENCGAKLK